MAQEYIIADSMIRKRFPHLDRYSVIGKDREDGFIQIGKVLAANGIFDTSVDVAIRSLKDGEVKYWFYAIVPGQKLDGGKRGVMYSSQRSRGSGGIAIFSSKY